MDEEKLCQNLNAILDRLTFANSSINIFKSILTAYRKEGKELFVRDINFWKVVTDNCCLRTLVELAKTYDEGKDSVGLMKIINQTDQICSDEATKILLKDARKRYNDLEPLRNKLRVLRDKGFAHSDKKYAADLNALVTTYGLPLDELDLLLNTAADICSDILGTITEKGRSVELTLPDDATEIIEDMKYARSHRKSEHDSLMKMLESIGYTIDETVE